MLIDVNQLLCLESHVHTFMSCIRSLLHDIVSACSCKHSRCHYRGSVLALRPHNLKRPNLSVLSLLIQTPSLNINTHVHQINVCPHAWIQPATWQVSGSTHEGKHFSSSHNSVHQCFIFVDFCCHSTQVRFILLIFNQYISATSST